MEAIDQILRPNLRRLRAHRLVAAVMSEVNKNPALDDVYRDVVRILIKVFSEEGVDVLTDYERAELGLPPRGPDGWTVEEIIALERRRLEILSKPLNFTIPSWDDIRGQYVDLSSFSREPGVKP